MEVQWDLAGARYKFGLQADDCAMTPALSNGTLVYGLPGSNVAFPRFSTGMQVSMLHVLQTKQLRQHWVAVRFCTSSTFRLDLALVSKN